MFARRRACGDGDLDIAAGHHRTQRFQVRAASRGAARYAATPPRRPDAFDCSALTMMAYRSAGIAIPRTSQEQWAAGPYVPPGQEKPGDLVLFPGSDGTAQAPGMWVLSWAAG
jgi:cell wall-associated NlpC family hydrolase